MCRTRENLRYQQHCAACPVCLAALIWWIQMMKAPEERSLLTGFLIPAMFLPGDPSSIASGTTTSEPELWVLPVTLGGWEICPAIRNCWTGSQSGSVMKREDR